MASASANPPVFDDGWRLPAPLRPRIAELLPPRPAHPLGCQHPRVDDRRAMDAISFVLRTGCRWNARNATGICSGSSAQRRFQEWVAAGVLRRLWQLGLTEYDGLKEIEWRWQAMDGATTKAPLGGKNTGPNPTVRGKLGVKRSILTDAAGVPIGVSVDGANRNDHKLARATLVSVSVERPEPTAEAPQGPCLDKGYDCVEAFALAEEFGYEPHIRPIGEGRRGKRRPGRREARRWVVARSHNWLNRFRRILVRWEKKAANYQAMLHLAFAMIAYRAAGLLG